MLTRLLYGDNACSKLIASVSQLLISCRVKVISHFNLVSINRMEWSTISALHVLVLYAFLRMGIVEGAKSQNLCLMFVCVFSLYLCMDSVGRFDLRNS